MLRHLLHQTWPSVTTTPYQRTAALRKVITKNKHRRTKPNKHGARQLLSRLLLFWKTEFLFLSKSPFHLFTYAKGLSRKWSPFLCRQLSCLFLLPHTSPLYLMEARGRWKSWQQVLPKRFSLSLEEWEKTRVDLGWEVYTLNEKIRMMVRQDLWAWEGKWWPSCWTGINDHSTLTVRVYQLSTSWGTAVLAGRQRELGLFERATAFREWSRSSGLNLLSPQY